MVRCQARSFSSLEHKGVKGLKALETLCSIIDKIATAVTAAMMIFLTVLIGVNVVSRFVLNSPIAWQYEATLVCLSWVVFIGMSITFRKDEHMRLTFVANALPEKFRPIWIVIMDLFVLAFLVAGGICSISVVQNAMPTLYQTIPVSRGLFYMPFPIGCLLSVIHIINNSIKRLKGIPINPPAAE